MENKVDYDKIKPLLHPSWHNKMQGWFESKECWDLSQYLKSEKAKGRVVLPDGQYIWRCMLETPLDELKIVFMGLSPYFTPGVADGLAFSCSRTQKEQPSLRILLNAVQDDLENIPDERNPDLKRWAKQGILLLNAALSCEEQKPDKHLEVWKPFITYLYNNVFNTINGLIFVYFGKEAAKYSKLEQPFMHYSFQVEHPSAAARGMREMNHQNVFSKVNRILKENNGKEFCINWLD